MTDPDPATGRERKFGSLRRLRTKLADDDGRSVFGTYKAVNAAEIEAMVRHREEAAEVNRVLEARDAILEEMLTRLEGLELQAAEIRQNIKTLQVKKREKFLWSSCLSFFSLFRNKLCSLRPI